jgi:hypothetical protein
MRIAYYVDGHGFGHAKRASAIITEFVRQHPSIEIFVRTSAPKSTFTIVDRAHVHNFGSDFAVMESDALAIDVPASVDSLTRFLRVYPTLVERETDFVRRREIDGLIADVAFIAGDIAERTARSCATVLNFTWDWIMEPWLVEVQAGNRMLAKMKDAYSKMSLALRTPFSHAMHATFRPTILEDIPLALCDMTRENQITAWDRLANRFAINAKAFENVVYCSLRGKMSSPRLKLTTLMRKSKTTFFLFAEDRTTLGANWASLGPELSYNEAFNACNIFVGKLGYCTVGNCIAAKKRLLFPTRLGFREDDLLRQVGTCIPAVEISRSDFESGAWGAGLTYLVNARSHGATIQVNGVELSVRKLLSHFRVH